MTEFEFMSERDQMIMEERTRVEQRAQERQKRNDLLAVIRDVHGQKGDDVCWMDIDRIFKAAGLSVPDRKVGDKKAMLKNCERYIDTMCSGIGWPTYAEVHGIVYSLSRLASGQGTEVDALIAEARKVCPVDESARVPLQQLSRARTPSSSLSQDHG